MVKLYSNNNPPQPLVIGISRLLNTWQYIEGVIESYIWGLAALNETQGSSFTAHMTFPLRCDVLRSLYHLEFQNPGADKQLNKIIENRLKPAHATRNKYAHAVWLKDKEGTPIFLEKEARGKPYFKPITISGEKVFDDITSVIAAWAVLDAFMIGVDAEHYLEVMFEDLPEGPMKSGVPDDLAWIEYRLHPTKPNKPPPPPRSSRV